MKCYLNFFVTLFSKDMGSNDTLCNEKCIAN